MRGKRQKHLVVQPNSQCRGRGFDSLPLHFLLHDRPAESAWSSICSSETFVLFTKTTLAEIVGTPCSTLEMVTDTIGKKNEAPPLSR